MSLQDKPPKLYDWCLEAKKATVQLPSSLMSTRQMFILRERNKIWITGKHLHTQIVSSPTLLVIMIYTYIRAFTYTTRLQNLASHELLCIRARVVEFPLQAVALVLQVSARILQFLGKELYQRRAQTSRQVVLDDTMKIYIFSFFLWGRKEVSKAYRKQWDTTPTPN